MGRWVEVSPDEVVDVGPGDEEEEDDDDDESEGVMSGSDCAARGGDSCSMLMVDGVEVRSVLTQVPNGFCLL